MAVAQNIAFIKNKIGNAVTLVAVSKTKPATLIREAYEAGHRDFGENYAQELLEKQEMLPHDIRWHMIGHLQSNKVKYIAPFVYLIHGVDSLKLLKEINKQGAKNNRVIGCLLQVHIAQEETKFGFDPDEIIALIKNPELGSMHHIEIRGLMTMGSNTQDMAQVEREFKQVKELFDKVRSLIYGLQNSTSNVAENSVSEVLNQKSETQLTEQSPTTPISPNPRQPQTSNFKPQILSMGMSGDYELAIQCGSNMVRIGNLIFGERHSYR
ncbi:MAG TPA: YggS family pyridoxal phosphate-dependent enzyme [Flavobacteriales bacterium]|nr:YggS family pyridoxal phosphate-dependent enzyme [Flavobacteriales bacterium]